MATRKILHIDISTSDSKASAAFFKRVFGFEHQTMEEFDYTTFQTENTGGGFVKVGENDVEVGDIVVFISSDDINADLDAIEANGGKRLSDKIDMPGYGSMAYFSDPTGNKLGLWCNES